MDEAELQSWVGTNRKIVFRYLESQGIENPNVAQWPAFEVAPHFAIWAIESKEVAGKIGWWAFSGDCPTDYVTEDGKCHPRAALQNLLFSWESCIPEIKEGRHPPNVKFGDGFNLKELGDLLEARVKVLKDWLNDDDLWEER